MRIDDFAVRRVSLAVSVIGLLAVIALAEFSAPVDAAPWEIDDSMLGKDVRTSGIVKWTHMVKGVLIFEIGEGSGISAVVLSPDERELALIVKGGRVEIGGRVEDYEGNIEIVVNKVRALD